MAEQASTEGGYLMENTKTTIFVHLIKALATHQELIFKECSEIETVKNLYPHEDYRRIISTVNNRANYWVHKCFSMNLENLDQLCSHVKTPCESIPPFLKAIYSQNSFPKWKGACSAAFAATCLVYAENYGIADLQERQLVEILWLSGIRCEMLTNGQAINEGFYLPPEDAGGLFTCQEPVIIACVSIESDGTEVNLNGEISFRKGSSELLDALKVFRESHYVYAIMTIDRQSLALVKYERCIFIFYPQPTDGNGKVTLFSRQGAGACLKRFPEDKLDDVCKDLCLGFFMVAVNQNTAEQQKRYTSSTFKITLVKVNKRD